MPDILQNSAVCVCDRFNCPTPDTATMYKVHTGCVRQDGDLNFEAKVWQLFDKSFSLTIGCCCSCSSSSFARDSLLSRVASWPHTSQCGKWKVEGGAWPRCSSQMCCCKFRSNLNCLTHPTSGHCRLQLRSLHMDLQNVLAQILPVADDLAACVANLVVHPSRHSRCDLLISSADCALRGSLSGCIIDQV